MRSPARRRNQNSEYLPQRRKACPERRRRGRKEIKLPDLAFLASWREQIPFFGQPLNAFYHIADCFQPEVMRLRQGAVSDLSSTAF